MRRDHARQPERRAIGHLNTLVKRLDRDRRFATAAARLEKGWHAFGELRDVLQLTNAELPRAEARYHQIALPEIEARRLAEIEQAVDSYRQELRQRVPPEESASTTNPSPSTVIVKYLQRYGDRLFGHPTLRDHTGAIVAVTERTNNVPERFFGDQKQQLRRRLGRANLARDLEEQPAQAALAANLRHPDYVRALCGSLENLPTAFAELDVSALEQASPLTRTHRDSALQPRIRDLLRLDLAASPTDDPGTAKADPAPPATVS